MDNINLNSKIALVTGGTGTIGGAISKTLASKGAKVIFTYLTNKKKAMSIKSELICKSKNNHLALQMDVTYRKSVKDVIEYIKKNFGYLDVLVNNAGINNPNDFDKVTDDEWNKILSVNLTGPFIVTQEALSILKEGAAIINIGSVSGQYGGPRSPHYAVSKAGLIGLSQVIARFLANRKIRVNTISAGFIQSEMADKGLKDSSVKKVMESILLKRMGTPQEIANVAAFLASENSSYITAQTINVNGGLYF